MARPKRSTQETTVGARDCEVNARRLFVGSCAALVATSVAFATVGAVMFDLKGEFVLTNAQVGWIGGAALWGFALSQAVFAPLCDTLGMRALVRMAFVGHLAGTLLLVLSPGFGSLFAGALLIAMANGLVEAACNPLVATLYPNEKTVKLNHFHVWFPGGIVLGGLASFGLGGIGVESWEARVGLILIPTAVYGWLLLAERFPPTEGARSGVSVGEMFRATLTTPFMWLMLVCMAITASVELGPGRWLPAVLEAGGMAGILVLVYINGIMAAMRLYAGPVVHRLSPTGVLLASAALSGAGLFWLGAGGGMASILAAATVFAVGVCYFWPTMLGVVSERVPKSGALGLGLTGTVGMAVVGLVTAPLMGRVADRAGFETLGEERVRGHLVEVGRDLGATLEHIDGAEAAIVVEELEGAERAIAEALDALGRLEPASRARTTGALRAASALEIESAAVDSVRAMLAAADSHGGLASFRYLAPLAGVLALVFGTLYLRERRRGGYQAASIS